MKRVIIVGAGPCGILLAHYLLRRNARYKIDIYERRSDPRKVSLLNSKTIPYGLNERGLKALRKIEGLEAAIKAISVKNIASVRHNTNGKVQVYTKKKPTFNLDRLSLVTALLSQLTEKWDNQQVQIHFDCKCIKVDFQNKTLSFEKNQETAAGKQTEEFNVNYDLLVGADGARSTVRTNFLNTDFFELDQKYVYGCYKTIFLSDPDKNTSSNLKTNCLHVWRIEGGINFGLVPQLGDKFIGLLFFPRKIDRIVNFSRQEEVMEFFKQNIPEVAPLISETEAKAFLSRPIGTQLKIRCNRYHYGDSVLIIGDAAHAVSSALGQGCNTAFEDVLIFDSLLDEYCDEWATAIEQFTIRRQPDTHALWELDTNVFPSTKALFTEFILREGFAKIMNKILPQFFVPPLQELLFSSTLPYSDILKSYQGWISKVKSHNEKLFSVQD